MKYREFEFRAWDSYHQEMINWSKYKDELVSEDFINHGKGPLVVMQYTGLKDKNGKEIYEGDILEIGLGDVVDRYEVLWEGYGFAVRKRLTIKQGKKIKERAVLVNRAAIENHADVIGNIYMRMQIC